MSLLQYLAAAQRFEVGAEGLAIYTDPESGAAALLFQPAEQS